MVNQYLQSIGKYPQHPVGDKLGEFAHRPSPLSYSGEFPDKTMHDLEDL